MVTGTLGTLVPIALIHHQFFLVGDKQVQYLPVMSDIGRRLRAGEILPVIDPVLGPSGNYAVDLQYGLYDPFHWLVAIGLSLVSSAPLAAFAWSAGLLLILATGTCAVAMRAGSQPGWAALAGVGVATSGFVLFWLTPYWMPGLASIAWLPWWWWATLRPVRGSPRSSEPWRMVLVAAFAFLLVIAGWPASWLIFGAAVVGWLAEAVVRRDRSVSGREAWRPVLATGCATVAGIATGLIGVVALVLTAGYTSRATGVGDAGLLVPNVGDILAFASPTMTGLLTSWGDRTTLSAPVFFAGWFAVVLLWCTRWDKRVWQHPGVVTAAVGFIGCVLLTQLPSSLGPIRIPIRQLAGVQFFGITGCILAASALGLLVTRTRVAGIFATIGAMSLLAWSRTPNDVGTHLLGVCALVVAAAVLVFALRRTRSAALVALAVTVVFTVGNSARLSDAAPFDYVANDAYAAQPQPAFPSHLATPAMVLFPDNAVDQLQQSTRVGVGFVSLSADNRLMPGYSSITPPAWRSPLCLRGGIKVATSCTVARLTAVAGGGQLWVDRLGLRTLVVARGALVKAWLQAQVPGWRRTGESADFVVFARTAANARTLPGRVTWVSAADATVSLPSDGAQPTTRTQSYEVAAPSGATLAFSDAYWPGYTASVDGTPVRLTAHEGGLVEVLLPRGTWGLLTVRYDPPGQWIRRGLGVVGLALLALAVGLSRREDDEPDDGPFSPRGLREEG